MLAATLAHGLRGMYVPFALAAFLPSPTSAAGVFFSQIILVQLVMATRSP